MAAQGHFAFLTNRTDALELIEAEHRQHAVVELAIRDLKDQRRLLSMPGRLTRTARTWTLHLPARWPWHENFTTALEQIRALPPPA